MGRLISLGFVLLALASISPPALSDELTNRELPLAIDFEESLPWLNVSKPLSLKALRGKVVILDFWTYGCINCIHVLEDLDRLQEKYGHQLAIIGIHTPKFDNEKNLETLRRIIVRYGITHPVVNDIDSILARQYGMRAWPTQYVITPQGRVLGKVSGEGNYDLFEQVIDKLLAEQTHTPNTKPLPITLESDKLQSSFLAFPGKIAVSDSQVAVSDTLHHRIVITDHEGKVERIIGGNTAGFKDGNSETARFTRPQGLAFSKDSLLVADTGNHSIRAINLASGQVSTIAGTGNVALTVRQNNAATKTSLRSPWGLALWDKQLLIAMAGDHQIWALDLERNSIKPFSGNGHESLTDGALEEASYSQPSGLSLINNKLYVADSESSAVREIDLKLKQVRTLTGKGLFEFGDKDGELSNALLQHVLGIAALNETQLFVADTYNHKLKLIDLSKGSIQTVAGNGAAGEAPDETALNEPGGLAVLDNKILVADTNHHRIMQYDPITGQLSLWTITE